MIFCTAHNPLLYPETRFVFLHASQRWTCCRRHMLTQGTSTTRETKRSPWFRRKRDRCRGLAGRPDRYPEVASWHPSFRASWNGGGPCPRREALRGKRSTGPLPFASSRSHTGGPGSSHLRLTQRIDCHIARNHNDGHIWQSSRGSQVFLCSSSLSTSRPSSPPFGCSYSVAPYASPPSGIAPFIGHWMYCRRF